MKFASLSYILLYFLNFCTDLALSATPSDECEVCVSMVKRFAATLDNSIKDNPKEIEKAFKVFCKGTKSKENQFCYYLGGLEESATGILKKLSEPLAVPLPPEVICRKLKAVDSQICELHYDKQIDFKTVDLKKLKVKELKKILNTWDETCDGCVEKADIIKRIEELKPKYVRDEL
ncbi:unnamed protein product [Bemisia tabaci]|uniref:Mesencephalic astrocyte-derived neurotrophic factor homolog n=1 Tax=Bemisia tabaci TaxID=7038 RepID=A0A9P0A6D9_BEMTA|nr:PREDICTED: mesencephalic astrocyte-derived neurotrophic factor homolog [Bemisia tabaci]CAH0384312.1 unnamed protein product [Bemisia tabaci]